MEPFYVTGRSGKGPTGLTMAVAVSGGADSLALAILAAQWIRRRGAITALIVDHGLRPESAEEARQVGQWLHQRGIAHQILRWQPPDDSRANLQARARDARYDLLAGWCLDHRIGYLLLGHHRDDQAETFMLRLARGSGVEGLAGMRGTTTRSYLEILRPLLDVPKAEMVAYLRHLKQPWIEDPSNGNDAFARARMRKLMPVLAEEGLTSERIIATARHMADANEALDYAQKAYIAAYADVQDAGYAMLDLAEFGPVPRAVKTRIVAKLLMALGGNPYPPRYDSLLRLTGDVAGYFNEPDRLGNGCTLGGCCIMPHTKTKIMILRETRDLAAPVLLKGAQVPWDGRFTFSRQKWGDNFPGGATVGALTEADLRDLRKVAPWVRATKIPAALLPSLPALRDGQGLLAVPHLEYSREKDSRFDGQVPDWLHDCVISGPRARLGLTGGFTLV